ncbi:MAG: hypothetical protein AAF533_25570 [Acidobacteriota bacterium]
MTSSLLIGCAKRPVTSHEPIGVPTSGAELGGTPLKAVLFPYIPDSVGDDFASLIEYLTTEFEKAHPEIDLEIVIDQNLDLYDYSPDGVLSQLLGDGEGAAQVVEIDTLLLGNLVESDWVQPLGLENPGMYRTAWEAASLADVQYGMPTYVCSNVIYAMKPGLGGVGNAWELLEFLREAGPADVPLVGNYKGSWTLPSTYLDSWADTHDNDPSDVAGAFELPLDHDTLMWFQQVVTSCQVPGGTDNPCLDGTYQYNTAAEDAFAAGASNGYIGYTERLFYILQAMTDPMLPDVTSAPIGGGTNPVMFVDALVFNPNCDGECLEASQAFATFMSRTEVRSVIAFSLDGLPGTPPRYLLQARADFYTSEPAVSDPMYEAYVPIVESAQPLPSQGFPDSRKALDAALTEALEGALVEAAARR